MGAKQATQEQKTTTLRYAFKRLTEGTKSRDVTEELVELAKTDQGFFPFKDSTLRVEFAKWKKGGLPEISLDATEEKPVKYERSQAVITTLEPPPAPFIEDKPQAAPVTEARVKEIFGESISQMRDFFQTEMRDYVMGVIAEQVAGIGADIDELRDERSQAVIITPPTKDEIAEIATEVFSHLMNKHQIPDGALWDMDDVPPEPRLIPQGPAGGRPKQDREIERTTVTIDKALWKAFEDFRDRMRVTTGRALDILLWRALGKPRLSYETSGEDPEG